MSMIASQSALRSLQYTPVNQAPNLVQVCSTEVLMAKVHLRSTYRKVPIHPCDQHLLGIQWNDEQLIDRALPFGLRSGLKIFTAVMDALGWAIVKSGVTAKVDHPLSG